MANKTIVFLTAISVAFAKEATITENISLWEGVVVLKGQYI